MAVAVVLGHIEFAVADGLVVGIVSDMALAVVAAFLFLNCGKRPPFGTG